MELKIEYLPVDQLTPYEHNARKHQDIDVDAIAASIKEFGFDDPIGVWGEDNIIVEGHGRLMAAQKLGMDAVPVIRLDHLTDEQRRAYALAHNRTAELSEWDEIVGALEIAGVTELDMSKFGFFEAKTTSWFDRKEKAGKSRQDGNDEYNEFLEKFENKKTTDDCYTPDNIYDAVADWVAGEYGVSRAAFVRPFYPGGDYQSYKYPKGCVVVDNPPFSILSQIIRWFNAHEIKFFLFAPTMSLFTAAGEDVEYMPCGIQMLYENGADVNTSFINNLGENRIYVSAALYEAVNAANDENRGTAQKELPKYDYPDEVVLAARIYTLAKHGQTLRVPKGEAVYQNRLDDQKEAGKEAFGGVFLISERAAAERAAAERAAAERAAAKKWKLSERETKLIQSLES